MRKRRELTYTAGNGLEVACSNMDETVAIYNEIFRDRKYTSGRIVVLPGMTVIDAGAHIGLFSLFIAPRVAPGRVYAFEPNPYNITYLEANVRRYHPTVEVIPLGLGAVSGNVSFTLYLNCPALSGLSGTVDSSADRAAIAEALTRDFDESSGETRLRIRIDDLAEALLEVEHQELPVVSLRDALAMLDIGQVDLLKLDVQGAEYEVMAALPHEDWNRIRQITGEYHWSPDTKAPDDFASLLISSGFDVQMAREDTDKPRGRCGFTAVRRGG